MASLERLRLPLMVATVALVLGSIYMALVYAPKAPEESLGGDVQRIFYFHVASAWIAYLAFGVTFVASMLYLRSKDLRWDTWAHSSAEIGVLFCTLAIVTGPLWAKVVWKVFWRWEDLKLLMTLVLWLVFIAYVALRANVPDRRKRAGLSAVFGIVGMLTIPLSFSANRIWSQYHPTVIATSSGAIETAEMAQALVVAVVAFTFLYVTMLLMRVEVERLRDKVEELKQRVGD
jgi:heme exporter protein C